MNADPPAVPPRSIPPRDGGTGDSGSGDPGSGDSGSGGSANTGRAAGRGRGSGGLALGALCGLLAGAAAVAVGELAALAAGGAESAPAVAVGQRAIDLAPQSVKEFAIRNFGSGDKGALLTGVYAVLLVASAAIGILARRHLNLASCAAAAFGIVGIVAAETRASAPPGAWFPSLLGGAAAVFVLRWLTRLGHEASDSVTDRRRFLLAVAGTAIGAAAGGFGAKAWLDSRFDAGPARAAVKIPPPVEPLAAVPAATHPNVPGLGTFFTPNSQFYRVDTALTVPQVDPSQWTLQIRGMVDRPVRMTFAELLALPLDEHDLTLTCVSNPVGGPYCGNARWIGAPLAPLLRRAGVHSGADQILATSTDGMTIGTPLSAVLDGREAMLAVAMNGEALPIEHGFPCRMLVPGLYGYVSATKWVVDLNLTTFSAAQAYWVGEGWAQQAPVKTASRIDVPHDGDSVTSGSVVIAGTAWATHRGVAGVEVQVDGGAWHEATLAASDTPDTWRQWTYTWDAPRGQHRIAVRATDGTGTVQTSTVQDPVPNGATGYHQISVNVN
ncbi:MAG TPA: molybdopterin-dependent oxidoreductase [Actinocrinis sp.]|nr:molybdopterin-dependent oxidoreductase [Actinocrinis sp.]